MDGCEEVSSSSESAIFFRVLVEALSVSMTTASATTFESVELSRTTPSRRERRRVDAQWVLVGC